MHEPREAKKSGKEPSMWSDIRLIFATILTDPGSSLVYGADALVTVTIALIAANSQQGMWVTFAGGAIIMGVYLIAILVYNSMTRHHTHKVLGGGALVSALLTSEQLRTPWKKKLLQFMGKSGTASLLADFPATQAISIIAGIEALYFIPVTDRLWYAFGLITFLSFIQRYGLGNIAKYMIWPVMLFYICNLSINAYGIITILERGTWIYPIVPAGAGINWIPILFLSVAAGSTLITGVEVGYSSVNIPHHKGAAIRRSMWILYGIVLLTYSMQLINFMGLGVTYDKHLLIPLNIARHLNWGVIATGFGTLHMAEVVVPAFGIIMATMLLLAAQTAQTDFPLEILRASRSNFFPRGIGDTAWRKVKAGVGLSGHHGLYNPRATILLGILSGIILYFFPSSHKIEAMYGLAVIMAMNIDIASYLLRQLHAKKYSILTILGMVIMSLMLGNILFSKFLEGAWFIVLLMILYMGLFLFSEKIYEIWFEKLNTVPLEFGLWYPAFQGLEVERNNMILVSKFHPGIIHFLKGYIKSGKLPLAVHFQTNPNEKLPDSVPDWFESVKVPPGVDTITAISQYVRENKPDRVHLIPLLIRGIDPIQKYYFSNSIDALRHTLSEIADVQVEYNRERVLISSREIFKRLLPFLPWDK